MMTGKAVKALGFVLACGISVFTAKLDAAAVQSDSSFPSGSSIAGIGVAMDRYERIGGESGDQAVSAGLTQDKIRYLTISDLYSNIGIADVEGYLNIREKPDSSGALVGKLEALGGCEILGIDKGWYRIRSGPVTGYVYGKYLIAGRSARVQAIRNMRLMVRVDTQTLRVRRSPGTDSEVIGKIGEGETYEAVSSAGGGWEKIRFQDTYGYVSLPGNASLAYTVPEAIKVGDVSSTLRRKVVNYAVQFVGNRYQWGGTNPNTGADCSGFVQYVMGHAAGVEMNRTSRDQANQGQKISSSQMKPGDLVFYASGGVVNHVAMYIGDGQIVHAASAKSGIKISRWNYRAPAVIRRVLSN